MDNKRQKNLCIIQARMGATRLPGKVLKKVKGITLLEYEIRRVRQAKKIDKIVVATSLGKADNKIETFCKKISIDCFRGSEDDVLDRYYQCFLQYPQYKNIIRITGDCPLIDPVVIDEVIEFFIKGKYEYACNVDEETYPDGMDIEIFKRQVLTESARKAKLPSEREHVTQYMRKGKRFKRGNLVAPHNWSHFRFTVDEPEDFEVVKFIIAKSKVNASYLDYINLLVENPEVMKKNINIIRNEGLLKSLKKDKI